MTPVLSVIIPTYKRTSSLKKLLEILLEQKEVNLEIIVVDQNATNYFDDDLKLVLQQVRWIRQENPNVSDARNRGFMASAAEYLLFIDDDLIPEPDFCFRGMDIFRQYPEIGCFVPIVYNDEGKEQAIAAARSKYISPMPANKEIFSITDTISAAIFFRREVFLDTGGFDDLLFEFAKTAEDQEFFFRMLGKGITLWFVPLVEVYHDEKVSGGCDLRTDDYWITREKCMKAWALRFRTQAKGKMTPGDFVQFLRSCVLNLEVIKSSPKYIVRQASLMMKTMKESRLFFENRQGEYFSRINNGFLNKTSS